MQSSHSPWYLDWAMWAFIVALVAFVCSQIPPLRIAFKKRRLEINVHSRISLNHTVGNPIIDILVGLRNVGGRKLHVKNLTFHLSRDNKALPDLPAKSFFETGTATNSVIFIPFTLKPEEQWTHSVSFYNELERQDERSHRENMAALLAEVRRMCAARLPGDTAPVSAESRFIKPVIDMEERLFSWFPGDYVCELEVLVEPGDISFKSKYRFTVFDPESEILKARRADYNQGATLLFNVDESKPISLPITPI